MTWAMVDLRVRKLVVAFYDWCARHDDIPELTMFLVWSVSRVSALWRHLNVSRRRVTVSAWAAGPLAPVAPVAPVACHRSCCLGGGRRRRRR